MTFFAKTTSPLEWRAVAATIQTLVEEATFETTAEGINFRAMDPSHVALIDLQWPSTAFEKYDCDKQDKFSVRVEDLVKLIRRADAKDSIEITKAADDLLALKMVDGYRREFELHLIESGHGATPLPKLNFNTKFVTIENAFEKILNDISVVSDHITIDSNKEKVSFSGKSDSGRASATLDKNGTDLLELEVKEDSKATYSIEYLLNITKAAGSASDTISFEYSSKMPLRLEFKLSDTGGRIHFFLAPRVES
jgi:proliferating cell nuclear antigen